MSVVMTEILWQDENEFLSVTIYQNAATVIVDKSTGSQWRMGHVVLQEDNPIDVGHVWLRTTRTLCEEYPGRFQGEREGNMFRFTLLGRERRVVGCFSCRVRLDGARLTYELDEIDESIPGLMFPPPIESESLVLPMGVGRWIRKPLPERRFWVYPAHLNMRWLGGLQGENGWIAIIEEGYANAGALVTGLSATPGWLKSLGRWQGSRRISYQFVPGNYVALAKVFRSYALEQGLHRSLEEKMADYPALRNLHEGTLLSFMQAHTLKRERFEDSFWRYAPEDAELDTGKAHVMISHAQVRELLTSAMRQGVQHALVVLRGWIKGGYDESHPDVWPPEPEVGTLEELQQLVELDDPLTVALHDNYQDIYQQSESWPAGVIRLPNGDPMPGGYWAGGQAYILNARDGLAYARRNWENLKALHTRSMFIDTTVAVQLYESYEEGNTLSREQDLGYKVDLLNFYKDEQQVLGSEEGADFGIPWLDWIENRHSRSAGESIPLWPLVYHDAVFNLRYGPGALRPEGGAGGAPRWLTDMLWGYPLIWGARNYEKWQQDLNDFAQLQHVRDWIAQIGSDEMLSHRYWSEDGQVEETIFASGQAILVNFAPEERTVDGVTVPGHSYLLR